MDKLFITKALMEVLSNVNEDSVYDHQYNDLLKAGPNESAAMVVNPWYPFEDHDVEELLKVIEDLAKSFEAVYKMGMSEREQLIALVPEDTSVWADDNHLDGPKEFVGRAKALERIKGIALIDEHFKETKESPMQMSEDRLIEIGYNFYGIYAL